MTFLEPFEMFGRSVQAGYNAASAPLDLDTVTPGSSKKKVTKNQNNK